MSKRIQKVNQLIKKELSQILLKEVEFSRDILVTVSKIETSPNLAESNVWVSIFPEKETKKVLEILSKKIYFLQQKLNQRLRMRPIPRIKFLEEKEIRLAGRVEELLEELKKNEK